METIWGDIEASEKLCVCQQQQQVPAYRVRVGYWYSE